MASSALPLSLLAKGIGQVVTNGHEKLEVYLEPEDYYNWKSYSPYHVAALQESEQLHVGGADTKPIHLHKTFVTRKGALLIFSEELANKAIAEEERRLNLKRQTRLYEKQLEDVGETSSKYQESDDPLRTVHDLRVAILMYGNRPDYRKRGDDLYLRFIHEAKAPRDERKIRPGFSPKRYITAWSKYWQDEMLQKMRVTGLVQDKTIYRQNPLLPHLYQPASYNLSAEPPPYRVTKNMLHAADAGNFEYRRSRRIHIQTDLLSDKRERSSIKGDVPQTTRMEPPPSTISKVVKDEANQAPLPKGSIQAVRFLETGEIQEVKYSELKPQEKQEILAELLETAYEHGKHIEEMLDSLMASNKPRTQSAASSSAASELMMDMHRAILSLAESPVQRQIRDKQKGLKAEQERMKKKQEKEEAKLERKKQRKKKREEREAQIAKEKEEAQLAAKKREEEKKLAKQKRAQQELNNEAELIEKQKQAENEEREKRREARRDARRKKDEHKAARKKEKEEIARRQEEEEKRLLEEKRQREELLEQERRRKEERREERRRLRAEKKQQKEEEHARALEASRKKEKHLSLAQSSEDQSPKKDTNATFQAVDEAPTPMLQSEIHQIPSGEVQSDTYSQDEGVVMQVKVSEPHDGRMKSRPTPSVPQNTPATQQRTTRIERQFPLETVIYEARSKRSQASSSTTSSSLRSRKRVKPYPPGSLVSAGDGEFAHYTQPQQVTQQQHVTKHTKQRKLSPLQPQPSFTVEPAMSHASSYSSKQKVFPAELPGDSLSSQGKSSFYGGAMPITSNIVKQTLSDKISILSASQAPSLSGSIQQKSLSERSAHMSQFQDTQNVPVIGVEPPTPIQNTGVIIKQPPEPRMLSSPIPSNSTRSRKLQKVTEKESSTEYSNESEDEPYLSDHSSRSVPQSQHDDDLAVADTKKSSTTASGGSVSEVKYKALKGFKGPGSQSSAATLSIKTGSKKSSSITRGSLPNALLRQDKAAIYMPDKEIVKLDRRDIEQSTTTDKTTTEESKSVSFGREKLSIKPSLKSVTQSDSSVKSSRQVSFREEDEEENVETTEEETGKEHVEEEEEETESEEESEEEDAGDWPQVTQDTRPISSRSAKLTEHAQKVAKLVVSTQRPDSRLDEDATEAVKIWNKLAAKSEEGSESEEAESEEESEEEDESSAGWNAGQVQEEEIIEAEEEKEIKEDKQEKTIKTTEKKPVVKEIVARKPKPARTSVKSFKSSSSGKTSISSVQEAFVKEVKRKASELGIDESELQFDPQLVGKVMNSTVEPNELEVFHDTESGKHIVRSRHSSVTTKSYRTDTTDSSATRETKTKQKVVIDMPVQEILARSASPHPSVSTATSSTASPTSPTKFRAQSQASSVQSRRRKSSIPVDGEKVELEYGLTSYERKLGDPKPEEPVTVKSRPKIEPEKLEPDTSPTGEKEKSRRVSKEKTAKDAASKEKSKEKTAKEKAAKDSSKEKFAKEKTALSDDLSGILDKSGTESVSTLDTKMDQGSKSKQTDAKSKSSKKAGKKGRSKGETKISSDAKKETELSPVAQSPEKHPTKTPEVPFVAGRAKQEKAPKGLQSPEVSTTPKPKKSKKPEAQAEPTPKKEPKTQVEMEGKIKTKVSDAKIKSKEEQKEEKVEEPAVSVEKESKTPEAPSPTKSIAKQKSEVDDDDVLSPIPAASPEDDYTFVRVEETPVPSEPEVPAVAEEKPDDAKSQVSDQTAPTETTEKSDNAEDLLKAAEDEAENEAKLAKKREKEERRLAGAEKRRLEVERKRKEKEEQLKREKEEQERQDQLKEELENERKRRAVEMQRKREEAEREREREKEEEMLRKKREEQQKEREKRLQEEHKKKMEELQRKKKEEEARKAELARMKAEEEERARKEEEELMAQMAEDERIEYERRKEEEALRKKIEEEERRRREIEEAEIAMEQARLQAIIRAKQQAALEEKLKFAREFFIESNGMEQSQNVSKAFSFSYFELLQMLGLEFKDVFDD